MRDGRKGKGRAEKDGPRRSTATPTPPHTSPLRLLPQTVSSSSKTPSQPPHSARIAWRTPNPPLSYRYERFRRRRKQDVARRRSLCCVRPLCGIEEIAQRRARRGCGREISRLCGWRGRLAYLRKDVAQSNPRDGEKGAERVPADIPNSLTNLPPNSPYF
jgi:hypothetical protein